MKLITSCVCNVIAILLFVGRARVVTQLVIPAEEGKPIKLSCPSPSSNMSEVDRQEWLWSREALTKCEPNKTCTNYSPAFTASLVGTVSYLTIASVSRVTPFNMNTQLTCRWFLNTEKKEIHHNINLAVFAPPRDVSCDFQLDNIAQPRATCFAEGVFPIPNGYAVVSYSKRKEFKHDDLSGQSERMNSTSEYYSIKFNATWDRFFLGTNHLKFRVSLKGVYGKDSNSFIYRVGLIDPLTNVTIDPELDSGVPSSETHLILLIIFGALTAVFATATVVLGLCLLNSRKTRGFQPAADAAPELTVESTRKYYNDMLPQDEGDQHDYEPVPRPEILVPQKTLVEQRSPVKVMLPLEPRHPGNNKQSQDEACPYANFQAYKEPEEFYQN